MLASSIMLSNLYIDICIYNYDKKILTNGRILYVMSFFISQKYPSMFLVLYVAATHDS